MQPTLIRDVLAIANLGESAGVEDGVGTRSVWAGSPRRLVDERPAGRRVVPLLLPASLPTRPLSTPDVPDASLSDSVAC